MVPAGVAPKLVNVISSSKICPEYCSSRKSVGTSIALERNCRNSFRGLSGAKAVVVVSFVTKTSFTEIILSHRKLYQWAEITDLLWWLYFFNLKNRNCIVIFAFIIQVPWSWFSKISNTLAERLLLKFFRLMHLASKDFSYLLWDKANWQAGFMNDDTIENISWITRDICTWEWSAVGGLDLGTHTCDICSLLALGF